MILRLLTSLCLAAFVGLTPCLVAAQESTAPARSELERLKRENDELKRENARLKSELQSLQQGTAKAAAEPEEKVSVMLENVEYVYQGMERSGGNLLVTLIATSKKGDQLAANGPMTLIDDEGDRYEGMPLKGFGLRPKLLEGVPLKLVWRFGSNLVSGESSAPSAKITRFTLMSVPLTVGGNKSSIEFRDITVMSKKSK